MNLEDRLRSHMHSGDDLFVETGRDAGAIAAAGRRRTRRNQVGGAAAGGMLALGLVFGVASQTGGGEQQEFATEAEDSTESMDSGALPLDSASSEFDPAASEMAEIGPMDAPLDEATEAQPGPDGVIGYEVIVGVADGFAGLRTNEDGISAITSDDGADWMSTPTNGIPSGAEVTGIEHADGLFAAAFVVYDDVAGAFASHIGTSTDLVNWTLEVVDVGDDFEAPFVTEVVVSSAEVVAVVPVSPPLGAGVPSIFVLRGPAGGPYESTLLPDSGFGVSELTAADDVVMFVVSGDDGSQVWSSTSGGPWTIVRETPFPQFPSLERVGSGIFLFDGAGAERFNTGESSWEPVDLDGVSDANVVGTASVLDTSAVLLERLNEQDLSQSFTLVAGSADSLVVVPTDELVPERAFVLLAAVSDEEVLLEVFPEPVFDEDLAASGGLVEVAPGNFPQYVRVPLA